MEEMPKEIWANQHKVWSTSEKYLNNKGKPRPASHSKAKRIKYIRADVVDNDTNVAIKCFYEDDPPAKFVAIYSDGSGCEIFTRQEKNAYISPSMEGCVIDKGWFFDAGYLWFLPLPDDFPVWEDQKEKISPKIQDKG